MIEIKLICNTPDALRTDVAELYTMVFGAAASQAVQPMPTLASDDAPEQAEKPKRTRGPNKPKDPPAPTVEAQQAPAPAASVESLFGGAPVVEPTAKPTQKELIAAFRVLAESLGKEKGTDAIVAILKKHSAQSVVLIPEANWAAAIADATAAAK